MIIFLKNMYIRITIFTIKYHMSNSNDIITNAPMVYTNRKYTEIYEYCTMCGSCIKQCPSDAINVHGKDKDVCRKYLDAHKEQYAPRFGCGKCQVKVPCMDKIPAK